MWNLSNIICDVIIILICSLKIHFIISLNIYLRLPTGMINLGMFLRLWAHKGGENLFSLDNAEDREAMLPASFVADSSPEK